MRDEREVGPVGRFHEYAHDHEHDDDHRDLPTTHVSVRVAQLSD